MPNFGDYSLINNNSYISATSNFNNNYRKHNRSIVLNQTNIRPIKNNIII